LETGRIQNILNPGCFFGTPRLTDINKENEDKIEININSLIHYLINIGYHRIRGAGIVQYL